MFQFFGGVLGAAQSVVLPVEAGFSPDSYNAQNVISMCWDMKGFCAVTALPLSGASA